MVSLSSSASDVRGKFGRMAQYQLKRPSLQVPKKESFEVMKHNKIALVITPDGAELAVRLASIIRWIGTVVSVCSMINLVRF